MSGLRGTPSLVARYNVTFRCDTVVISKILYARDEIAYLVSKEHTDKDNDVEVWKEKAGQASIPLRLRSEK